MHPMIQVQRIASSPTDEPIFQVVIKYREGPWTFTDRQWSSEAEALADIPLLQSTKRLPSDAELNEA